MEKKSPKRASLVYHDPNYCTEDAHDVLVGQERMNVERTNRTAGALKPAKEGGISLGRAYEYGNQGYQFFWIPRRQRTVIRQASRLIKPSDTDKHIQSS